MSEIQTIPIFCAANSLDIWDDGEIFHAEPYLWSFYWKVDGETLSAIVSIRITPDGPSEEANFELSADFTPFVVARGTVGNLGEVEDTDLNPDPENNWVLRRNFLAIPPEVGRFETDLVPIPVKIDFSFGESGRELFNLFFPDGLSEQTIQEVLLAAIDNGQLSELADILNAVDPNIFDIDFSTIGEWLALPEIDECPPLQAEDIEEMVSYIGTQFVTGANGGIAGVFGAIYILMENDQFSQAHSDSVRDGFADWLRETFTSVIGELSLERIDIEPSELETAFIPLDAGMNLAGDMFLPLFAQVGQGFAAAENTVSDIRAGYGGPFNLETAVSRMYQMSAGIAAIFGIADFDDTVLIAQRYQEHQGFLGDVREISGESGVFGEEGDDPLPLYDWWVGGWRLNGLMGLRTDEDAEAEDDT